MASRMLASLRFAKAPTLKYYFKQQRKLTRNSVNISKYLFSFNGQNESNRYQQMLDNMMNESVFSLETAEGSLNEIQLQIQLFSTITSSAIKLKKVANNIFMIYCKNEYKYFIKISSKLHLKLLSYTVDYPNSKHLTKEIFLDLSRQIQNCLSDPSTAISNIHTILHSFFKTGQMYLLSNVLVQLQTDYHYKLTKIDDSILLEFNERLIHYNSFTFSYEGDDIIVKSNFPYFTPPENCKPYFSMNKYSTLHTHIDLDTDEGIKTLPSLIHFKVVNFAPCMIEKLLCQMRDIVYYSNLCRNLNPIINTMIFVGKPSDHHLVLHYNPKYSKFGHIMLEIPDQDEYIIEVDEITNNIIVKSLNSTTKIVFSRAGVDAEQPLTQIFIQIFKDLFSLKISPGFTLTTDSMSSSSLFNFVISYAPHFSVIFMKDNLKPKILVIDQNGKEYFCPETIKLNSLVREFDIRQSILQIGNAVSTLVFILEVQYLLQENHCRTERCANGLTFTYPHLSSAKITTDEFQWRMTIIFDNSACLHIYERSFQLSGQIHSARSAEYVMELLHRFTSYMNLSGHMLYGSATIDAVLRETFSFNHDGIFTTNCRIKGVADSAYFAVSFTNEYVFEGKSSMHQSFRIGYSLPIVDTRFTRNYTSNNSLSYADISLSADTKFIAYLIHSSISMVSLERIADRPGWKLLSWSSPTVFQLIYKSKYTVNVELKPMHNLYLCIASKTPSAALIVPLASLTVNNATNAKSAYRIRYTVPELLKVIPDVERYIKRYEDTQSVGFGDGQLVMKNVPQIVFSAPGLYCFLDKEKTQLQSDSNAELNTELQALPMTADVMRLCMSLVQRPVLLLFAVRILRQLYTIDKEAAETSAATTYIENRSVIMNINGFPFELTEGKAICGDLFFMNNQKEIELALMQIVK